MSLSELYDTRPFDEVDMWMTAIAVVVFAVIAYLGYRKLPPIPQTERAEADIDSHTLGDDEVSAKV